MISRLRGTLVSREPSIVEVATPGGVVYEVEVPLTILEKLPQPGEDVELRIVQVVREDSLSLYGFLEAHERELFRRLMTASGVGARLALAMLSTYSARRLARALAEKDLLALTQISGIGKKSAERIALELSEKVRDLALGPEEASDVPVAVGEAVSALVALGFSFSSADAAVREAFKKEGDAPSEVLIRRALSER